jgi:hypothetical protein
MDTLNSGLLWCGLWMTMSSFLLSGYYHELAIKLENEFLDFRNKCVALLLSLLLSLVLPSQMAALHSVMELVKNEVPGKFNNKLYFKLCSTLICSKGFSGDILGVFVSDYFKYPDVVYFTYSSIEQMAIKVNAKKLTASDNISSDDEGTDIPTDTSVVCTTKFETFLMFW